MERALLRKLEGEDDSEDDLRSKSDSGSSEGPNVPVEVPSASNYSDIQRLRELIDPEAPMTGPKGVIVDYKFGQMASELRSKAKNAMAYSARSSAMANHNDVDSIDISELIDKFEPQLHTKKWYDELHKQLTKARKYAVEPLYSEVELLKEEKDIITVLDTSPRDTLVVISYYSDSISGCLWLNDILTLAASEYPHIRFCKVPVSSINEYIDPIVFPMLIFHQNSKTINVITRVNDLIPGWHESVASSYSVFKDIVTQKGFFETLPAQEQSKQKMENQEYN